MWRDIVDHRVDLLKKMTDTWGRDGLRRSETAKDKSSAERSISLVGATADVSLESLSIDEVSQDEAVSDSANSPTEGDWSSEESSLSGMCLQTECTNC